MALRLYQKEDKKEITTLLEENNSVIYACPTGGGKSVTAVSILEEHIKEGGRILFLTHRRSLLNQIKKYFENLDIEMGDLIGSNLNEVKKQFVTCSINTAQRNDRLPILSNEEFTMVVIDECHRSVSKGYNIVIDELFWRKNERNSNSVKLLGLTATPSRLDKKPLSRNFNVLYVSKENVKTLIDKKFLADYKIYTTPTENFKSEVEKNSGGDFRISQLSAYMRKPKSIKYAVDSIIEYANNRKILSFCVDLEHAEQIEQKYKEELIGWTIIKITGKTSDEEREKIFEKFEKSSGKIVIISVETMIEGIDLPSCNCIQILRPTESFVIHFQMIGRGLRPKEDGGNCIVLDNAMNNVRLGEPKSELDWQLDAEIQKKKKDTITVIIDKNGNHHGVEDVEDVVE